LKGETLFRKIRAVQDYLTNNSKNFVKIEIEMDKTSTVIDFMQDHILDKIHDTFKTKKF
jgi:hypothetical protein